MKKRILSFVLSFCLLVSGAFALSACDGGKGGKPLTNAELSVLYKQVAADAWDEVGLNAPEDTSAAATTMSVTIPDKKTETTDASTIANITMNANSMAGFVYMVGLLYANEDFSVTDGIAVFDAPQVSVGGQSVDQEYILKTSLDKSRNKVKVEVIVTVMGTQQYSNVEIDYNFSTNALTAFRFYTGIGTMMFGDMAKTADGKMLYFDTNDTTDDFAVAVTAKRQEFADGAASIEKLSATFTAEVQTYLDAVMSAMPN